MLSFLIFKNIYENSKYNKCFVENQIREQDFETKENNGLEFKMAVGSYWPKGGSNGPPIGVGAPGMRPHPVGGCWPYAFANGT